MITPTVLLLFANDRRAEGSGHLASLADERRELVSLYRPLHRSRQITLDVDTEATLTTTLDSMSQWQTELTLIHFGGHATASGLLFEGEDGRPLEALARGLARRFSTLPRLRLIVLNGCLTAAQVSHIHGQTRATVIGTTRAVPDGEARRFARRLHHGLASGLSVGDAFSGAESEWMSRSVADRLRHARPAEDSARYANCPWRMFAHPRDAVAGEWQLVKHAPARVIRRIQSTGGAPPAHLPRLLAKAFWEPAEARAVLIESGLSPSSMPPFESTPIAWWTAVVDQLRHGAGDWQTVIEVALAHRPRNADLAALHPVDRDR